MKGALTRTQFFDILCHRTKLSDKTVKKVMEELFLLMVEELRFTGEFHLPRIAKFTTEQRGGKDMKCFGQDFIYIDEYTAIKIKPKNDLIDFVNGRPKTKEAKKRVRKGLKSKSDEQLENLTFEDKERNLDNLISQLENKKGIDG